MTTYGHPLTLTVEEMREMEKDLGLEPESVVNKYVTPGEKWKPLTGKEFIEKFKDPPEN